MRQRTTLEDLLIEAMRRLDDPVAVRLLEEAHSRLRLLRSRIDRAIVLWSDGSYVGIGHLLYGIRDLLGEDV